MSRVDLLDKKHICEKVGENTKNTTLWDKVNKCGNDETDMKRTYVEEDKCFHNNAKVSNIQLPVKYKVDDGTLKDIYVPFCLPKNNNSVATSNEIKQKYINLKAKWTVTEFCKAYGCASNEVNRTS